MKTKQLLLTTILFTAITAANAKTWRVNNNANATNGSNFGGTVAYPVFQQLLGTTATSANGSNLVLAGDTVHIEGSPNIYVGGNLTKRLVIIGPGYFLNENPDVSPNLLSANLSAIDFNVTSAGSQIIGVHISSSNGIDVNTSDILIKRCRIDRDVALTDNITDIRILQNYFSRTDASSVLLALSNGMANDVVFNNNIVQATLILQVGYTLLECRNNVFAGPSINGNPSLRIYAGSFRNNIMTNPAATTSINGGSNTNVTFNTGASAAQFGTGNNNVAVADMTTLFVTTGTSDGKYQLQPGSATGSDGTERGAFGGSAASNRYTLSGLAAIPVIYEIITTGIADATGLPITIKAKTIK